jgi:hypothetical protein
MNNSILIENDTEILFNSDTGEVIFTRKPESFSEPKYRRQVDWYFLYHYSRQRGCAAAASLLDVLANNVYTNNKLRDNPMLLDHGMDGRQYRRAMQKLIEDGIIKETNDNRVTISPVYVWYGDYGFRDRSIHNWYTGQYKD